MLTRIGWSDPAFEQSPSDDDDNDLTGDSGSAWSTRRPGNTQPTGGLGPQGTGRRYPIATVLKRNRNGLGWHKAGRFGDGAKECARITHFAPRDSKAVESRWNGSLRSRVRLDSQLPRRNHERERKQERKLREQLNLTDDQLAFLYGEEW